jgi:hypothetical protein
MGIFDFLFGKKNCPLCGAQGAKADGAKVRCPNPECRNFDGSLGRGGLLRAAGMRQPRRSDYSPANPIEIRYRNFRGEEKIFKADQDSLLRRRNHIVARVAPTGERISLSRDRIQNLSDVEYALPQLEEKRADGPTPRERRVLAFHKSHGSSSPLYEEIRRKYPDY